MAKSDIHFEVFIKKHKKASWTLVEATEDRQTALDLAHKLQARHAKGSVRVKREQWISEESAFVGGTILETGAERFVEPEVKTGEASLPCLTPEDLAGSAARDTVRRVLSGWLERKQVAPLELLHRPELIEELDGSDTDLQHAVQKVAIARAQNSDASVHAFVRIINDLVEKGVAQARKAAKKRKRDTSSDGFARIVEKIHADGAPERRLRTAIADKLADHRDFTAKASALLDLCQELPASAEARAFALAEVDNFLAEMLSFDGAARGLMGKTDDLGDEVLRLTAIYEGSPSGPDLLDAPEIARRLAERFASQALPVSHIEIAKRILSALRGPKRFRPDSVMAEVELARKLAQRLIAASGPNLHPDSLVEAFTHRSSKLLAPAAIEEALANSKDPSEQIERLYKMEDNLVGEQNKTKLAGYIRAQLKAPKSESFFIRGEGSPFERLARLAALQERAAQGAFPEKDKQELVDAFDRVGLAVLDETKVLNRLGASDQAPLDRARALLKLAARGILPTGQCLNDAKARAMRILSDEMGQSAASLPENRSTVLEIQTLMQALSPASEDAGAVTAKSA